MKVEDFIKIVEPYTMTTKPRIISLYESLEEIRIKKIEGDIVECGVWKGGNILGIVEYLSFHNMKRNIWLYDTFQGMTETSSYDVDYNGNSGHTWINKCDCSLEEVKENLKISSYDSNLINFIVGDITETLNIEKNVPKKISILRLDTDWYESTLKELTILYPRVTENGIIIIDDYGHWMGAKKAVTEFFGSNFNRFEEIDYSAIKFNKNI